MTAARDDIERLREEIVRLQARVDELEAAELARQEQTRERRGLASLIPFDARR